MHRFKISPFFIALTILLLAAGCSDDSKKKTEGSAVAEPDSKTKVGKLKLPEGFHADHLFGPSENGEGSWVSMTFDGKGRLIASDQYGALYRMQVPAVGDTTTKIKVERL